jgi:drug/metabolite transporter (DMT)-like permease
MKDKHTHMSVMRLTHGLPRSSLGRFQREEQRVEQRSDTAIGAQYLAAAVVWGASFLFIKVGVSSLSPVQVVLGRLTFGAMALVAIMLVSGRRWPRGRTTWAHLTAIGVLLCVAPFLLFSWAAQHLPSGLSSIYNATTPIMTVLVALTFLPEERLTRLRMAAMLVAAGGIVLVAAPWQIAVDATSPQFLLAQAACLGATICYGLGFTYSRRFLRDHPYDPTTVAASQIGAAALVMITLSPFIGLSPTRPTFASLASVAVLGVIGTGIAYIWYSNVINSWGATIASTVTYLTPVTGIALGVAVLGEHIRWNEIVGGGVVILGVLVSQGRIRARRSRERSSVAAR